MAPMVTMLWIAGAVQLAIALANAPLAACCRFERTWRESRRF